MDVVEGWQEHIVQKTEVNRYVLPVTYGISQAETCVLSLSIPRPLHAYIVRPSARFKWYLVVLAAGVPFREC